MSTYLNRPVGADYYVTKSGNDAWTGTAETFQGGSIGPKLTIAAGLAIIGTGAGAGADKIIQVGNGSYAESLTGSWPSGTSGHPFTLRAANALGATLNPSGNNIQIIHTDIDQNYYLTLDGFSLDGANITGTNYEALLDFKFGRFVTFKNGEVKNSQGSHAPGAGAANWCYVGPVSDAGNITISNTSIHDGGGSDYGVYCEGSNCTFDQLHVYNVGGYGILIFSSIPGDNPDNNTISNSRIHDICLNLDRNQALWGVSLQTGTGNKCFNTICHDCIGLVNGAGCFESAGGATNSVFYNCSAYNSTWFGFRFPAASGSIMRNCVAYLCSGNYDGNAATADHNVTDGTNPQWLDPANGDFHLTGSTPGTIHDAGTDLSAQGFSNDYYGTTRPKGAAWDIGAAELVE